MTCDSLTRLNKADLNLIQNHMQYTVIVLAGNTTRSIFKICGKHCICCSEKKMISQTALIMLEYSPFQECKNSAEALNEVISAADTAPYGPQSIRIGLLLTNC